MVHCVIYATTKDVRILRMPMAELTKRHRLGKFCRFCSAILLLVRHYRLPKPAKSISL